MIDDVVKIACCQPHIERKQNRTCLQYTVIGFEKAMTVMAQVRHDVAFPYPQTGQSVGEPINTLAKLGIAEAPTLADNSHFLREEFLGPAQEHEWGQGNNHCDGFLRRWQEQRISEAVVCCRQKRLII